MANEHKSAGDWGKPLPPSKLENGLTILGRKTGPVIIVVSGVLILAVIGWLAFRALSGGGIDLGIISPTEVQAGQPIDFEIGFTNDSPAELFDLTLMIRADEGTEFLASPDSLVVERSLVDKLPIGGMRKEVVSAALWGREGETRSVEVTVRYRRGDGQNSFEKSVSRKVKISKSVLSLSATVPQNVIVTEPFSASFSWRNESDRDLTGLMAQLDPGEGFELISANPTPHATGTPFIWELAKLDPDTADQISLQGRATGQEFEIKKFDFQVGTSVRGKFIPLVGSKFETGVKPNPLAVAVSTNGFQDYKANLGEVLSYTLSFKNNSEFTLKDVAIAATLEGNIYDPASVVTDGAYSSKDHKIVWHGGNTSQLLALNPQEDGNVTFQVKIKDAFPAGAFQPAVKVTAKISTATKPESVGMETELSQTAESVVKINGLADITSAVYRRDPQGLYSNTGPWPLKANSVSQLAVYVNIKAAGSDFKDIRVSGILPNNVAFDGKVKGDLAGTEFVANPRTNEIIWKISRLPAGTAKRLSFQIAVTPSTAQIGQTIPILPEIALDAIDDWTGNNYAKHTEAKDSTLPDDSTVKSGQGTVQP